jgi:hypothetical protein
MLAGSPLTSSNCPGNFSTVLPVRDDFGVVRNEHFFELADRFRGDEFEVWLGFGFAVQP